MQSLSRVPQKDFFNDFIFSFLFMLKLDLLKLFKKGKIFFRGHELEQNRFSDFEKIERAFNKRKPNTL